MVLPDFRPGQDAIQWGISVRGRIGDLGTKEGV